MPLLRFFFAHVRKLLMMIPGAVRRMTVALGLVLMLVSQQAQAQPAPALRSVSIVAVASTQYPSWDYLQGALITSKDHGGGQLVIATAEYGYANTQIAKFNGIRMTPHPTLKDEPILNGRTVIGWVRYWQYTGSFTSGQVTFQATSSVFVSGRGYPTYSTFVNIR